MTDQPLREMLQAMYALRAVLVNNLHDVKADPEGRAWWKEKLEACDERIQQLVDLGREAMAKEKHD